MSEDEKKRLEFEGYVHYIRGLNGKTKDANEMIIRKGRELDLNVIEIENDEQASMTRIKL